MRVRKNPPAERRAWVAARRSARARVRVCRCARCARKNVWQVRCAGKRENARGKPNAPETRTQVGSCKGTCARATNGKGKGKGANRGNGQARMGANEPANQNARKREKAGKCA